MGTSIQKPGVPWKGGQSGPRILLSVGLFITLLGIGWLIGNQFIAPSMPIPRGLVQVHCEQFELDNETGLMRPKGIAAECDDIRTPLPPRSGDGAGPVGRLIGIGDHFKSR